MSEDNRKRFVIARRDKFWAVEGYINEHSDLSKAAVDGDELLLDLEQVEFINSVGCKAWLIFIDSQKEKTIEYHGVSIPMMTAISMLPGLLPPAGKEAIKSFMLPYFCMNCNQEMEFKVEPSQLKIVDGTAFVDLLACKHCGSPAVVTEENSEFLYLYV